MKCETAQLEIILLGSGELPEQRTQALELHIQDCTAWQ